MKLILGNEIELEVLSSSEVMGIDESVWFLTIEAQGTISSSQISGLVKEKRFTQSVLQDENQNIKDLSSYELVSNIRITYGEVFEDNIIRIQFKLGE